MNLDPLDAFDKPRFMRTAADDLAIGLAYLAAILILAGLAALFLVWRKKRAEAWREKWRRRSERRGPR